MKNILATLGFSVFYGGLTLFVNRFISVVKNPTAFSTFVIYGGLLTLYLGTIIMVNREINLEKRARRNKSRNIVVNQSKKSKAQKSA